MSASGLEGLRASFRGSDPVWHEAQWMLRGGDLQRIHRTPELRCEREGCWPYSVKGGVRAPHRGLFLQPGIHGVVDRRMVEQIEVV